MNFQKFQNTILHKLTYEDYRRLKEDDVKDSDYNLSESEEDSIPICNKDFRKIF